MTKKKPTTQAAAKSGAAARTAEAPSESSKQLKVYEDAVQAFTQRTFEKSRNLFLEAAKGPQPNIADKARSYISVCERRMNGGQPDLKTAEDHFNYGVERLNARDFDRATHHLAEALVQQPKGDHILYTLALCRGMAGDGDGACEHLRRAIDIEPRNRILARQDSEFVTLASQYPALRAMLSSEAPSAW